MQTRHLSHRDGSSFDITFDDDVVHVFDNAPSKWEVRLDYGRWRVFRRSTSAERLTGSPKKISFTNEIYAELVRLGLKELLGNRTVDHINRDPLSNVSDNLRPATHSQQNRNLRRNTEHPGVGWEVARRSSTGGYWLARVTDPRTHRRFKLIRSTSDYDLVCNARDEFMWANYPEYPNPCPYPHEPPQPNA